ncbi:MAG: hypothetical protein ACYTXC_24790 [Nostoc sp.]
MSNSDHLDYDFHLNSVGEMLRIAKEVRIFPLITLMWKNSQHLDEIAKYYTSMGYKIDIEKVEYELQPGGIEEEFRSQNSGVRINQSGIQTRDFLVDH